MLKTIAKIFGGTLIVTLIGGIVFVVMIALSINDEDDYIPYYGK